MDSRAAARELLRHLHDPRALRRNPLTARFFTGSDSGDAASTRVRAAVRAALRDGTRGSVIVERCDLQGHAPKVVMAELGISRRQFYRDRAQAVTCVCAALGGGVHESIAAPPEMLRNRIESMHALLFTGHADVVRT